MSSAEEITKKSRSNLAFALACLPPRRRRDMISFYSFCRIVDDIADEPGPSPEFKRRELELWSESLTVEANEVPPGFGPGEADTLLAMRTILRDYGIDPSLPRQIIEGVSRDIEGVRFETFADLQEYCYLVASVVGLVSIEIMGYENPSCRNYAIELGHSLQLINIMRDIGEDLRNEGRIYLPREDLDRHGYSEADLQGQVHNESFIRLMEDYSKRALAHRKAALAHLDRADRASMYCPEVMAKTYLSLLARMRSDGFQVFRRRYRLSKARRALILFSGMAGAMLGGKRRDHSPVTR